MIKGKKQNFFGPLFLVKFLNHRGFPPPPPAPPCKGRIFIYNNPQPDGNLTSVTYFNRHLKPPTNWEFLNFLPPGGICYFLIIGKHSL